MIIYNPDRHTNKTTSLVGLTLLNYKGFVDFLFWSLWLETRRAH
jgi:hypothetical protein